MFVKLQKAFFLIVVLITVLFLFSSVALASDETTLVNQIDKTNAYIYHAIDKACEDADQVVIKNLDKIQKLEIKADDPNHNKAAKAQEKIEKLEQQLDDSIDKICEKLIEKTDKKVAVLIDKAAKQEIEIIKNNIEVEIYDTTVLVDPCCAH